MSIHQNGISLNLLVLRCTNLQASKAFYEDLGMIFVEEQHGKGSKHYSTELSGMILELYPLVDNQNIDHLRLGFTSTLVKERIVLSDPDGRKVELTPKSSIC